MNREYWMRLSRFGVGIILLTTILPQLQLILHPLAPEVADFGAFVMGARAVAAGRNPYDRQFDLLPANWHPTLNLNAPLSLLLSTPLAYVPPITGLRIWQIATVATYLGILAWLAWSDRPSRLRIVWAVAHAGFWSTVLWGQVYVFLLVAVALAWTRLRRGDAIGAGLCIGLIVALKPNYLVWPTLLLLAGHRRAGLASLASAACLAVLPVIAYGPAIYREWLHTSQETTLEAASLAVPSATVSLNVSLPGFVGHLGYPLAGLALAGIVLTLLATWAHFKRPDVLQLSAVAIAGTLLAGPVAWVGYSLLLLPALFARPWERLTILAAAILSVPYSLLVLASVLLPSLAMWVGSAYVPAIVLLLIALLRQPPARIESSGPSASTLLASCQGRAERSPVADFHRDISA